MLLIANAAFQSANADDFAGNGAYGSSLFGGLPGFEARGIKSGDFLLKSQISSGVAYDSNLFRTQSALSDYIFFVAPSFDLTRDGGNHLEELAAAIVSTRYARSEVDDFNSVYLNAGEKYQLSPASQILLNASFVDGYEKRVSSNHDIPTDAAAPVHYDLLLGSLGYSGTWTNYAAGATFTASHHTFDDVESTAGSILDQTHRDENDLSLQAFLNIKMSDHLESSLNFLATRSDIREQVRGSNSFKLSDTVNVTLTSKTSIGFSASVSEQDFYNNPLVQTRPLGGYETFFGWSPIQRLTFAARAGYYDIGVDFTKGFNGGGVGRYAALDAAYLIWRNLRLTSSFRYEADHLSGSQGFQTSISARTALTYEISARAGLSFLYTLQKLDSSSSQFLTYDENVFQTTLNLRF